MNVNNKNWKPKETEKYYYLNCVGIIEVDYWYGTKYDEMGYELGNVFKTKKEAEFELGKRKLLVELQRFADENNDEIDWKNANQTKFYIYYDYFEYFVHQKLLIDYTKFCQSINDIFFSSKELAQKAVDKFGDRIKKYLIGIKK